MSGLKVDSDIGIFAENSLQVHKFLLNFTEIAIIITILTLTVNKVKNGSHPSKYKGLGPFIFFRENRNVLKSA